MDSLDNEVGNSADYEYAAQSLDSSAIYGSMEGTGKEFFGSEVPMLSPVVQYMYAQVRRWCLYSMASHTGRMEITLWTK